MYVQNLQIVTKYILFMCSVKADLTGSKHMYVMGKGFQHVIDSNFLAVIPTNTKSVTWDK